jgi:hypothetical protein
MSGLKQTVDATFMAVVESGNVRYVTYPAAAAGTAVVSDGVVAAWAWAPYIQILAAAAIANPCWLCALSAHTGVVETHYGDLAVASGAAAAEVDLAMWPYVAGIPTAVGVSVALPSFLPYVIKIIGSPRLAARIRKSSAASAAGVTAKVVAATILGS